MNKMPCEEALQLAAQVWCEPTTSGITMDTRLAIEVARLIESLTWPNELAMALVMRQRGEAYTPHTLRAPACD
jgi:hypothetical protein